MQISDNMIQSFSVTRLGKSALLLRLLKKNNKYVNISQVAALRYFNRVGTWHLAEKTDHAPEMRLIL